MSNSPHKGQLGGVVGGLLKLFVVLAVLALITAAAGWWYLDREERRDGPMAESRIVWVKPGWGLNQIAAYLETEGVIREDLIFRLATYKRDMQSVLKAGEYEIPAGASVDDVLDILAEGKPYLHQITIAEGLTTKMVLKLIEKNDILEGEITLAPGEGTMLPETYSFPRGKTRDGIITLMMEAQDDLLAELWPTRQEGLPIKTPEEAVILASIVEKETGVGGERPVVAGVFVNRLRQGIRLQSDPTIIYGLTGGEPLGRGLRQSEIRGETPYNTYVIDGLPPTPIANPGAKAIEAVLNPAETDAIFFVADGTGGHVFAKTLAEHNRNVRKWREIERQRRSAQ